MYSPVIFILILSSCVVSEKKVIDFYPNLPLGEYRVDFKAILFCNKSRVNDLQMNFYLNKISSNVTMLNGNITNLIPFDDTLSYHVNMAVKDSIGGWKDNAYVYQTSKACTTMKNFAGNSWPVILNSFRLSECPWSPGVFITKGFDLTNAIAKGSFPKQMFYGTYKYRLFFKDIKNKQKGCIIFLIDIKRPWESA